VHPSEQAPKEPGSPTPAGGMPQPMTNFGAPPMGMPGMPGMPGMGGAPPGGMPNMFANLVPGMAGPGAPPMGGMGMPFGFGPQPSFAPPAAPPAFPPQYATPAPQPGQPQYPQQPQYGAPQQFSFVPPTPQQMMQPTPQPATSYAPAPQYGMPPQYGQPGAPVTRVVQYSQQPAAPAPKPAEVEKILVSISGRDGVNDVINGTFNSIGEHGGRYSFQKPTNEGPIYLYYDQASDNWCVGDQIGSQSYYAVCGPSNGQDMAQQWRVWTGEEWEVDPKMQATIH